MKLVSVIIPVYNVEEFIEECLVSVLNQTLKDIEIICVNDGTPDNSMSIIEKYAATDNRIVIVNKENGGLSSARNAGMRVAIGKYIYFMDSDDYILEDTLEKLCAAAEEKNLDTVFFDADSFFETEELKEAHKSYVEYYHRDYACKEVLPGQQFLKAMVENDDWRPSACLQMNRREMLLENDIWFKEGIIHEDNLFSLQVSLHSKAAMHMAERFYQRRVREDSIMTSRSAFRSAYGYYISIVESIPEIEKAIESDQYLPVYLKELSRMRKAATAMLKRLSAAEREQIQLDNVKDSLLFDMLIKDYAQQELKFNETKANLNREIKKHKKSLQKIKKSKAYKLGKILTAVPRKAKRFLKKMKSNSENNIKVSVILPVYNVETYLSPCLDSLLKQSLKKIEIICVDDQSTDMSYQILQDYARKDKRVKVLQQNHEGAGAARNLGMQYATGEYLLFLDADDFFDEKLCELTYLKAQENDSDVVLYATQRKDMQSGTVEKMGWVLRSAELPTEETFSAQDYPERIFQITSNCPWSKLFKTEFIKKHNIQYQNLKHANDVYFIRIALLLAEKIVVLDKVLVTYRYNMGDNTQSVKHLAPLEFYKAFIAVKEKMDQENLFDTYKKSYINWTLTESLFNYRTMKTDEAKQIIKDKLLSEGFKRMEISGCSEEMIYDKKLFKEYLEFID